MMNGMESLRRKINPFPDGRCLIGISGGADSMALLVLITGDHAFPNIRAEAVHINHGLRGDESDGDEEFVRKMCENHRIRLHVYHPDLHGKTDENTAREARFRCFRRCMEETGADYLVTAHHADDLAETFMMRLLRGAGPEGLGCMSMEDVRDGIRIFRPMLGIRRDEIRTALKADGICWREDSSNRDPRYFRNDVRIRLMPLLEEMNAGAAGRIAESARQIAAENGMLAETARNFLREHAGKHWLDSGALKGQHPTIQRRIIRQWWMDNAPDLEEHALNAEQTKRLTALALSERGKISMPGGLYAEKGRQALHLKGLLTDLLPETPVGTEKTDFGPFALVAAPARENPGDGKREQEVPAGWTDGCVIRTRKPGDRIIPFGMSGSRKLQDYLTDRGIDAAWRDEIPLLCRGKEVLLVAGIGAGNVPKWDEKEKRIRLIWQGSMPWER